MLVHGKLSGAGRRNNDIGLEVYATSRYFTMSGNRWHDCEDIIAEDNGIVDYVYKLALTRQNTYEAAYVSKAVASVLTDDELIKLASASRDSEDFNKLYRGEWQGTFKSQSEADYALCRKLAFWSGKNEGQIDRIFRTSGLIRDKWNTPHLGDGTTYGAKTITNACANTKKTYKPPRRNKPKNPANPFNPDDENSEVYEVVSEIFIKIGRAHV